MEHTDRTVLKGKRQQSRRKRMDRKATQMLIKKEG